MAELFTSEIPPAKARREYEELAIRHYGEKKAQHYIRTANHVLEYAPDWDLYLSALFHGLPYHRQKAGGARELPEAVQSRISPKAAAIIHQYSSFKRMDEVHEMDPAEITKLITKSGGDRSLLVLRLIDRLDTISQKGLPPDHRQEIGKMISSYYAVAAEKLNLHGLSTALSDAAFEVQYPVLYREVKKLISERVSKDLFEKQRAQLEGALERSGLEQKAGKKFQVQGRQKGVLSTFMKMFVDELEVRGGRIALKTTGEINSNGMPKLTREAEKSPLSKLTDWDAIPQKLLQQRIDKVRKKGIRDLLAFWVIVPSKDFASGVPYRVALKQFLLKHLRSYKINKDYFLNPKPNGFQATLLNDMRTPTEIQIRTEESHRLAEYGGGAHGAYKLGIAPGHEDLILMALGDYYNAIKRGEKRPHSYEHFMRLRAREVQSHNVLTHQGRQYRFHPMTPAREIGKALNPRQGLLIRKLEIEFPDQPGVLHEHDLNLPIPSGIIPHWRFAEKLGKGGPTEADLTIGKMSEYRVGRRKYLFPRWVKPIDVAHSVFPRRDEWKNVLSLHIKDERGRLSEHPLHKELPPGTAELIFNLGKKPKVTADWLKFATTRETRNAIAEHLRPKKK